MKYTLFQCLPGWSLLAFALSLCAATTHAGDLDDTVFLKNGGRARGVVVDDDPTTGLKLRLPSGALREYTRQEVDHVAYGHPGEVSQPSAATDAQQPSAVAVQPARGALRIESSEPGDVSIDGAEYGATPQLISSLADGPHRVTVRFHAGDSSSRVVGVRAGGETSVHFAATPSLEAFRVREGTHFGFGIEGGIAIGEYDPSGTFHVFGRVNHAFTRVFELRLDAEVGTFRVAHKETFVSTAFDEHYESSENAFGVNLRPDIQLNWGSIYSLSLGFDVGLNARTGLMFGAHISPLGFRFGEQREFMLNVQAGFFADGESSCLEVLTQLSYLIL